MNSLKTFIERRLSDDPLEPVCVFLPGGALVGFAGSSSALLQRWATLHGESDGDFRQAYGISSVASSTNDTFMLVDAAWLPSGTWLPMIKVSYSHVSAWALAYHLVDAIVIARVKKSIESL
jgi:hypothetical protein